MNVQVQICGILILILLFVFYKSHRTLQLYTEKVFYGTMCVALLNLSLDILSLIVIQFRADIPMVLVNFICKLYLVSLIWEVTFAFCYVLTDLFLKRKHTYLMRGIKWLTLIQSVIIFLLPIYLAEESRQMYTYGPAVTCVYVFVVIYIFAILSAIFILRKRINTRRALAVGIWMSVWIVAAVIQFINKDLLVAGFASALGILILFVIIENPEANLDRKIGCFNSYALSVYLKYLMECKSDYYILEISIGDSKAFEEDGTKNSEWLQRVIALVDKYKDAYAFKNIYSNVVIVSKDAEQLRVIGETILEMIPQVDAFCKGNTAILVTASEAFADVDDLFFFLDFVRSKYVIGKDEIFVADESVVQRYKEKYIIKKKIEEALSEDRVEVFLQPIYSNKEKRFTSAEALLRIREKDGSLLSPGIFIPIAEESGQILELGERVVEKVCQFLRSTDAIKWGIQYIEVNLSVIQCEMKDLAERLISIVEKYEVNPKFINLEITETASISARTTLLRNMERLIEYGFTFSLDDFGKGESNLMYVVEMPVSIIKLDYDISKAFFNIPKAKSVVRAVVELAHGMKLQVVAEGIETQYEIDGMCQEGVDYIQGYFYAKPMPMEAFLLFIQSKGAEQAGGMM